MNLNHDILVVDDEISNLQLLTELLEKDGYQVRSAETAQRALDSAMAHPPGLILLDIRMPEVDGFEVSRRLKKNPDTRNVPIIFISAVDVTEARKRSFAEGASDFITKPFLEVEVLARVKTHLRFHLMQQQLEEMVEERTRELRVSESRFRALMEQSPMSVALMAPAGNLILVNEAWRRLWGVTREHEKEIIEHYNILTDEELEARGVMPLIRKAFAGENVVLPAIEYAAKNTVNELGLDHINPNKAWIQIHVSPVKNENDEVLFVVVTNVDMTEITKAQQERERILNLSPDMISVSDMNAGLVYSNPAWQQVLGYSEEELKGMFLKDFVHPDDLVRVQKKREEVVEGEAAHDFEVRCLTKEGAVRDIALSCISVPEESLIYCVSRDITERKKMEQESRENRDVLARLDRTSSMGQLTGSIAHELNQPLTGILSNAQAAEMMLGNDRWDREELLETLADIVADTKRAGNVMRSLRDIYREQKGEFSPIEVNSLIEETLQLLHGEFVMQDIRLNVQNTPSKIVVDGNRVQLQQVLVNLLMNGEEAMRDLTRHDRCLAIGTSCDAEGIKVWVDDNGPGIDEEKIESIFKPLATWKPGGTGMGLAISDSIIRAHGGTMWAKNRTEGGACVGFLLPVSENPTI